MDLIIRLVVVGFGLIQTLLGLRLIVRFVEVPAALAQYVPALFRVTDLLIAPFLSFTDLLGIRIPDFGAVSPIGGGTFDRLEVAVIVALVGWSLLEMVVVLVLRVVGRVTPD